MKKFLCGALVLLAAVACVTGCKKNDSKSDTNITLNPAQLMLAPGQSMRISVKPNTGSYTWQSSNDSIATVSKNGTVTALVLGEADITCTEKESGASATCHVTVKSEWELIEFDHAIVWYYTADTVGKEPIDSVFNWTPDESKPLETVALRAYLVQIDIEMFSKGFGVDAEGTHVGPETGYITRFHGYGFYGPKGLNKDRGFDDVAAVDRGYYEINDSIGNKCLESCKVNEPAAIVYIKQALAAANEDKWDDYGKFMNQADSAGFPGSTLRRYDYNELSKRYYSSYLPGAVITEGGIVIGKWEKERNMAKVERYVVSAKPLAYGDIIPGLDIEQDQLSGKLILKSENFNWEKEVNYVYLPTQEEAPVRVMGSQLNTHETLTLNKRPQIFVAK